MDKIKEEAYEILDISQSIYQIQEKFNSTAIFKDKIFLLGEEDDREAISVKHNYEKKIVLIILKLQKLMVLLLKENMATTVLRHA